MPENVPHLQMFVCAIETDKTQKFKFHLAKVFVWVRVCRCTEIRFSYLHADIIHSSFGWGFFLKRNVSLISGNYSECTCSTNKLLVALPCPLNSSRTTDEVTQHKKLKQKKERRQPLPVYTHRAHVTWTNFANWLWTMNRFFRSRLCFLPSNVDGWRRIEIGSQVFHLIKHFAEN